MTGGSEGVEAPGQLEQGGAAAGNDSLFHRRPGGIEGVFDPQFAVLEFGFGGGTHLDHGHTTGQFGDPLIELFAVVIGVGVVELAANGANPGGYGVLVITGGHNRGAVFGDRDPAGAAQIRQGDLVEGHGLVFAHHGGAGEDGDVGQHGLAAIAKARRPHGGHLQHAPVLVHHQGGEGFAVHFFREDQQRLAGFGHGFQHRHQIGDCADLAVGDQQQGIFKDAFAPVLVGHEIGRAVAAIKGHAFGDLQLGGQGGGFLHGDHAIGTHLGHGLGNHAADFFVIASTHRGHLANGIAGDRLGALGNARHDGGRGLFHAAAHPHRVGTGGNVFEAFTHQGLGQDGGGGGAIAGFVFGFAGHLLDQLGADVFKGILEFDLLGDRHAIVDDVGGTKFLLEHHIAPLGPDGDLHGIGQGIDPALQGCAGGVREADQLGHGRLNWVGTFPQAPIGTLVRASGCWWG